MARYTDAKCRLCRREGEKLYLKGAKCWTVKCILNKKDRPPGVVSWKRPRVSEYGLQLREKQKLKRIYGIFERQFRIYFSRAERMKGNTGENLLVLLESRLDNVLHRSGLGLSRNHARQLVRHGHIAVNGRKMDIPSYIVRVGDVVTPIEKEKTVSLLKENKEIGRHIVVPSWIEVATDPKLEVRLIQEPQREGLKELGVDVREQLIIEIASK